MDSLDETLTQIKESMAATREVVKKLNERYTISAQSFIRTILTSYRSPCPRVKKGELDTKDGISLLSAKNSVMVQYLQSIVLLSAHRAQGHSLSDRTPPSKPFGAPERESRGSGAGDRVDSMIEGRVVLEKGHCRVAPMYRKHKPDHA